MKYVVLNYLHYYIDLHCMHDYESTSWLTRFPNQPIHFHPGLPHWNDHLWRPTARPSCQPGQWPVERLRYWGHGKHRIEALRWWHSLHSLFSSYFPINFPWCARLGESFGLFIGESEDVWEWYWQDNSSHTR